MEASLGSGSYKAQISMPCKIKKQGAIFIHWPKHTRDKDPFKIISLNLPVSTQKQQQYLEKKIREAKNALSLRFLRKKLKELQYLEWGRTNREYFLFLYGSTELGCKDRKIN